MNKNSKIFVAGSNGLVGSAIVRRLKAGGYTNLLTPEIDEIDLTDQRAVASFFAAEVPEYVFLAAAKVGGIYANNTYPADFIHVNLTIQNNVIDQAYRNGVKRLLFLGSSCIYPKEAAQPMSENALLTGLLEPTNEPYALAKIAGLKMCEAYNRQYGTQFVAVMPTNLYGPGITFIPKIRMYCLLSSAASTKPKQPAAKVNQHKALLSFGVQGRRCANSCMLTIWQTVACS